MHIACSYQCHEDSAGGGGGGGATVFCAFRQQNINRLLIKVVFSNNFSTINIQNTLIPKVSRTVEPL